MILIKFKIH